MSYQSTILADTPVVYYRLGEGSGTSATDTSGNSHTGTYNASGVTYGVAGALTGDADTAVTLNGSSGRMDTGVDAACNPGTGDFSVECWIKTTTSSILVAMGKLKIDLTGDNYWLGTGGVAHKASFSVANADNSLGATVSSSAVVDDGNWHHLVGVKDGTTIRLYVDSVADGTVSFVGTNAVNPTGDLYVGSFGQYSSVYEFLGSIDEAAYYASKLTPTRVLAHYNAGTGAGTPAMSLSPSTVDPHTTNITLTLVGTGTSWGGSTVFTVSGAGATKVSQNITTTTAATVVINTAPQSGVITVTESVTGTSSATTTALTYKKVLVTTGGVDVLIMEPANYVASVGAPLIYYHHGVGEDRMGLYNDLVGNVYKYQIVALMLSQGYLMAGVTGGASNINWGSQTSLDRYVTAFNYINSNYILKGTIIFSQSMGGCTGGLSFSKKLFTDVRGWIGIYPVCNLSDIYGLGLFTSDINSAYGITGTPPNTYALLTSGHDPLLEPTTNYNNRMMRFYASPADTIVPGNDNSTLMAAHVAAETIEHTVIPCTGDHGDPSHFQPSDFAAFCARCLSHPSIQSSGFL